MDEGGETDAVSQLGTDRWRREPEGGVKDETDGREEGDGLRVEEERGDDDTGACVALTLATDSIPLVTLRSNCIASTHTHIKGEEAAVRAANWGENKAKLPSAGGTVYLGFSSPQPWYQASRLSQFSLSSSYRVQQLSCQSAETP